MKLSSYYLHAAFRNCWKLPLFILAKRNARFLSIISPNPIYAGLNLTHNCNCRCITCNAWKTRSTDELSSEEVLKLLCDLKKLGVRGINLGGGEPLLRRDLPIIVTKAKSLGLIVNLTTNGILLSQRVAEDLLRRRLDSIVISIDGIGQTNDYIRGIKGLFERNLANLKMLAKLRDLLYPSLHVEIATTLMKPTLKDIKSLVALCTNLKISISFNLIDSSPILFKGISIKDLWIKDKGLLEFAIRDLHSLRASYPSAFASRQTHVSLEYIRDYFADPKQDQLPCILGYIYICVDPHGNVYPGCWVLPPVDNLRSRTLHEIFFSKKYRQRIAKMFKKQCPGCACGYQTNLIFDPKSIIKEVSWRLSFLRR